MAAIGELPCKVIDTSTAFRTAADWAYGFPELGADYKTAISTEKHIANPGCHASGMIACIAPLVKAGLVPTDEAAHENEGFIPTATSSRRK